MPANTAFHPFTSPLRLHQEHALYAPAPDDSSHSCRGQAGTTSPETPPFVSSWKSIDIQPTPYSVKPDERGYRQYQFISSLPVRILQTNGSRLDGEFRTQS